MIRGEDVTVEVGGRTLIDRASFFVGPRDHVGFVGANGAGKSSLISMVVGTPAPHVMTSGRVGAEGSLAYLPQLPVVGGLGREPHGFSHILSGRGLDRLDELLQQARQVMAEDPTEERIARFAHLEERFRQSGGYEVEATLARLADGLGLDQTLLFEDLDRLSGGQRRRIDLIRVLFEQADTLVLDEPTNHLDRSAKRWLTEELAKRRQALLIVSHDTVLLDQVIEKVLYLHDGELLEYVGNYSRFQVMRTADIEQRQRRRQLEDREIRRLSSLADSMRASTEDRARKAKVLDRRVERLRRGRTEIRKNERRRAFSLPPPARSGRTPLLVTNLSVSYGSNLVLRKIDLSLGRGDRLVVIGKNGMGKSSLLRCLASIQTPSQGDVEHGHGAVVGYFAQEHEQLDPSRRVIEHLDDRIVPAEADRRALLGSFGLTGEVAHQFPTSLSGGERARLSLAILACGRSNVLVLDEPTNNLDPPSVASLGHMLASWPGTIVAVSHDRPFVEALQPSHALHLPEERYDCWREEDLEDVERR